MRPKKPTAFCTWVDGRCPVCLTREYHATRPAKNPCRPNAFHQPKTPRKRLRKPLPGDE